MKEILYSFSDNWDIYPYCLYLNMDFSTWKRIDIQSIYRGGGEEHPVNVSLAEDGNTVSFTKPYDNVTVNYEIEPIIFKVDICETTSINEE